jgi:hypothetical protein
MAERTSCLSSARFFIRACISSFFAVIIRVFSSAVGVGPSVAVAVAAMLELERRKRSDAKLNAIPDPGPQAQYWTT